LAAGTLTNIVTKLRCNALGGSAAHELESRFDFAAREDVEKWGLLEARSQGLFERVVEHWVAGLVGEIAEDNRVLLGECIDEMCAYEKESCNRGRDNKSGGKREAIDAARVGW
jgi:hypothetical protein